MPISTTTTPEYLLLFRGNQWPRHLSAEQLQTLMSAFTGWFEELSTYGRLKAGQPLAPEGYLVSGAAGRTISDGPFAESKEAIGGYFLLQVDTMDDALAIARQCPGLEFGMQVEVRPVAAECPLMQSARRQAEEALAAANG